jgi:hypothetical protein
MASLWNRPGFSVSRIKMARLSAAKARVSQRRVYEQRSVWQRVARSWQLIRVIGTPSARSSCNLRDFWLLRSLAFFLWKTLTQKTIAIAPISVPKMLAENGYSAEVAAQRLHDALNKVVRDAHTRKNGPEVALQADLPSIVVPTIGLSLETIAADIRTFFHIKGRWRGSSQLHKSSFWLRLRINGRDFFASPKGVDPERPDELLAPAAEKVFERVDPYIAAASLSERDPGKCLEIARRIIANGPETDPIVPWAHNLVGLVRRRWPRSGKPSGSILTMRGPASF